MYKTFAAAAAIALTGIVATSAQAGELRIDREAAEAVPALLEQLGFSIQEREMIGAVFAPMRSVDASSADRLLDELEQGRGQDIRVLRAPCMGRCDGAPVAAHGALDGGRGFGGVWWSDEAAERSQDAAPVRRIGGVADHQHSGMRRCGHLGEAWRIATDEVHDGEYAHHWI